MKAITPNYVNELADVIAMALEHEFPDTLFVIQPTVAYGPRMLTRATQESGLHFTIRALLSEAEKNRDPAMVQQDAVGQLVRHITLVPTAGQKLHEDLSLKLWPLLDDLNRTILNPLRKTAHALPTDPQH
jgi:hypothetical protein